MSTSRVVSHWKVRMAGAAQTFAAALLFSVMVAFCLRFAWNPGPSSYLEYVPIGGVFAAFIWDRVFPSCSKNARLVVCDVIVVALALMRVFVPPLPLISGHALFSAYAALTARQWPLRAISLIVLAQVMYVKLYMSGGWLSMLGGFGVAILIAALQAIGRQRADVN
jgi:hypothetical protein